MSRSPTTEKVYDIVVLGGGIWGLWSAICAAKRGIKVALLEQFTPGHVNGSSHGDTRIYRKAYRDPLYVEMQSHSLPLWRELEEHAGVPLMAQVGILFVFGQCDRAQRDSEDLLDTFAKTKVPHSLRTGDDGGSGFEQISIPKSSTGLFSPEGGCLRADDSVAAAWSYCKTLGVESFTSFRANSLTRDEDSGCVTLQSRDGRAVTGEKLILAPGGWLPNVSDDLLGIQLAVKPTAETVHYYGLKSEFSGTDAPPHTWDTLPAMIVEEPNGTNSLGFFTLGVSGGGVKCAAHHVGPEIDLDDRPVAAGGSKPHDDETEALITEKARIAEEQNNNFVSRYFPYLEPVANRKATCVYTNAIDFNYLISLVPDWGGRVTIAGAGSGHGFKMAPSVGECAVALALGEDPPLDLSAFHIDRLLSKEFETRDLGYH